MLISALEFFKIIQVISVLLSGSLWRPQESTGEHRSAKEITGEHRRAQESTGENRRAQECTGEHRRAQESIK